MFYNIFLHECPKENTPDKEVNVKYSICGGTLLTEMHVLTALDCIIKDPEERVNVQPTRYGANGNLFVKVASSGKGYGEGGVFLPVMGVRYHPEAFLDGGHDNNLGKCFKLLVIFS